ncbi:unnamed protein product, partial [Litomosoides sigmodontis]
MIGKDFSAEKFNNLTDDLHFLKESTIAEVIDTVRQRAQSMIAADDQLLKLISFIDLTTLNSDDTNGVVERLIDKAVLPYPAKAETKCAAVCVYPARIAGARRYMQSKYDQQQSLPICS